MKPLQIVHAIVTLVLVVAVLAFSVLVVTGTIEVRIHAKGQDRLAVEKDNHQPPNPPGMMSRLVVVRGAKIGTEYPIFEGKNIVGRADEQPVEIDLADQESPDRVWCSRQHAVILCEKGSLTIEDLNTSNGTYVNRSRVPPGTKQNLKANDLIQIGAVQLKVLP
jgi:FHA domain